MKNRLKKLIVEYDLTPSKFAEVLGVQPSSISHLLSGRNNPSYDFISRVLSNFPKVNPDWLILGKGSIFRANTAPQSTIDVKDPVLEQSEQPNISIAMESKPKYNTDNLVQSPQTVNVSEQKPFAVVKEVIPAPLSSESLSTTNIEENSSKVAETPNKPLNNVSEDQQSSANSNNAEIERIVIFFKDGTFSQHKPR